MALIISDANILIDFEHAATRHCASLLEPRA